MNVQNGSLFGDGGFFERPFGATMGRHLEIHLFFKEIIQERHLMVIVRFFGSRQSDCVRVITPKTGSRKVLERRGGTPGEAKLAMYMDAMGWCLIIDYRKKVIILRVHLLGI